MAIIDLYKCHRRLNLETTTRLIGIALYLDHGISLNVILKPFQLKMEDRWEGLEDDSLLGILETIALCLILIFTIQRLHLNIIFERFIQVLHPLDIELDVYRS